VPGVNNDIGKERFAQIFREPEVITMSLHDISNSIILPLFMLNMMAIIVTLFIKRRIKPEFSGKLNKLFYAENVVGIICALALAIIGFMTKK
jgi:hypothetical protein